MSGVNLKGDAEQMKWISYFFFPNAIPSSVAMAPLPPYVGKQIIPNL